MAKVFAIIMIVLALGGCVWLVCTMPNTLRRKHNKYAVRATDRRFRGTSSHRVAMTIAEGIERISNKETIWSLESVLDALYELEVHNVHVQVDEYLLDTIIHTAVTISSYDSWVLLGAKEKEFKILREKVLVVRDDLRKRLIDNFNSEIGGLKMLGDEMAQEESGEVK